MSRIKVMLAPVRLRWRAELVALGLAVLFAHAGGQAAPAGAPDVPAPVSLPHSNSYLVTGDYVVGSVDLPSVSTTDGFLTAEIHMTGSEEVPPDAEILSAFLYFETIVSDPAQLKDVKFRGKSIHLDDMSVVKRSSLSLTGPTASCFSSGGGSGAIYTMHMVRADVRRLLPLHIDANGRSTRKRLVNDSDLENFVETVANPDGTFTSTVTPLPYHTVTLPEAGTGNQVPQSAGASLVVIYRDPTTQPLRRILLYDGIAVLPDVAGAQLTQLIHGIFQSSSTKSAKLTHLVGSGQPNGTERAYVTAKDPMSSAAVTSLVATNPFLGSSSASDRTWSSLTLNSQPFSNLMPGYTTTDGYGETVSTTVDHANRSPYDCLSWAAIIFSTAVKDAEVGPGGQVGDGLPDGLEDAVGGVNKDADGDPAPNLSGMGATSKQRDIFIEMDAMETTAAITKYGSAIALDDAFDAPYPLSPTPIVEAGPHDHLPPPATLKILIDAYRNSSDSPDLKIFPHFDVGNPEKLHRGAERSARRR